MGGGEGVRVGTGTWGLLGLTSKGRVGGEGG